MMACPICLAGPEFGTCRCGRFTVSLQSGYLEWTFMPTALSPRWVVLRNHILWARRIGSFVQEAVVMAEREELMEALICEAVADSILSS